MMGHLTHQVQWYDGSVPQRHLCFLVVAEQPLLIPDRYEAWLRLHELPVTKKMATALKIGVPESKDFHHDAPARRSVIRIERLDLLNKDSVLQFIAKVQAIAKREKLPVGIIGFETLASMVMGNLGQAETKRLVAHLALIARQLKCFVVLSCHTQRNNPREFKGLGELGNTDVIMIADRRDPNEPNLWLDVVRNKPGKDGFGVAFRGQEVLLEITKSGLHNIGLALHPIGRYELRGDKKDDALIGRRKEVVDKMNEGERLSATDLLKRLNWYAQATGGGAQFQALERLFPADAGWIAVALDNGRTHEIRHVVERRRHWFDCRKVEPAQPVPGPGVGLKIATIDGETVH
jgi:hypothetical protein